VVAVVTEGDPIVAQRARYARWAEWGQRVGYTCLAISVVAFIVAVAAGFPGPSVAIVIVGLAAATLVLPPAIIAGYAVKAAEREDRELMAPHRTHPPDPNPPADR
jgi:hypothetical protein